MRGLWCCVLVLARFKEEVGQYDWIQQNMGKMSSIDWRGTKVIVGTERGVVACMNKNGTVDWRHVNPNTKAIVKVLALGGMIVSLASDGALMGRSSEGDLLWQRIGHNDGGHMHLAAAENDLVFSTATRAERRSPVGEVQWTVDAQEGETILGVVKDTVLIEASRGDFTAYRIKPNGERGQSWKVECKGALTILGEYALSLSPSHVSVCPLSKQSGATHFDLTKWKPATPSPWRFQGSNHVDVVGITNGVHTVVARVVDGSINVLTELSGAAAIGPVFGKNAEANLVSVAQTSDTDTRLYVYDPASTQMSLVATIPVEAKSNHGGAALVVVREAMKTGDVRALVSFGDHSWAIFDKNTVVWHKEEALASISQALFGAAPKDDRVEEDADVLDLSPYGIPTVVSGPVATVLNGMVHVVTTLLKKNKSPHDSYLDIYCSTQYILCLSKQAGKLLALEAVTGDVAWSMYLGPVSDAFMLLENHQLVVMTEKDDRRTFMWVNPVTGEVFHKEDAGKKTGSKMALRSLRTTAEGPLPVIDVDVSHQQARVYPSNHTIPSRKHFHFDVKRDLNEIHGYVVGPQLDRLWTLSFHHVSEKILSVSTPVHQDEDTTPVTIKGDASVIYKYLNPNIAVVLTESLSIENPSLNVYLINTVTGQILHQSRIKNAIAPAKVLACENWAIVHYWNMVLTRFELYVVELFDPKTDDGPWPLVTNTMNHTARSVYELETPVPLEQTYIFSSGVKSMGVSTTAHGVTPRSILLSLDTDQILSLPKTLLNARRPDNSPESKRKIVKQFEPTKDEMIMPYQPFVPLRKLDFISYHQLVNVDDMVTHSSDMESTSLIFAYGTDLFFTIVQTANAFDLLSPMFNYFVLYTSVFAVIVMTIVAQIIADRKSVSERWK
eukprot:GEMP01013381.1.p1 GENE.GEMP01013381.1~~GEMP01013381.1.p1  ORF type:complete len:895 (-),score=274.50 GEMP01013381.1:112-2796(-)